MHGVLLEVVCGCSEVSFAELAGTDRVVVSLDWGFRNNWVQEQLGLTN